MPTFLPKKSPSTAFSIQFGISSPGLHKHFKCNTSPHCRERDKASVKCNHNDDIEWTIPIQMLSLAVCCRSRKFENNGSHSVDQSTATTSEWHQRVFSFLPFHFLRNYSTWWRANHLSAVIELRKKERKNEDEQKHSKLKKKRSRRINILLNS